MVGVRPGVCGAVEGGAVGIGPVWGGQWLWTVKRSQADATRERHGKGMGSIRGGAIAGPFAPVRQGFQSMRQHPRAGGRPGGAGDGAEVCNLAEGSSSPEHVTMCPLLRSADQSEGPALSRPHGRTTT